MLDICSEWWYSIRAFASDANQVNICESGGIGRLARLRGVWGDSYGFKSRLSHHFECSLRI